MKHALARWLWSGALHLLAPAYLAKLWQRGRAEPLYRHAIAERFGLGLSGADPGALWLHAVSLGETLAAAALVAALRRQRPGLRLLLTHGTATGRAAGQALLRDADRQAWLPYDSPGAVRRFLGHQRPALGVLMETEVWPNLMHQARAQGLAMVLANARLSERSAGRGHRLAALMRPAAEAFTLALAQTEDDARRLRAAGVSNVMVCGNLKYDLRPDPDLLARGQAWRAALGRPVLAAVNTRDGEEAPLLAIWAALPAPRPLLLIVPRHPQRFDVVAGLIDAAGLRLSRRSGWADRGPGHEAHRADVWLGDSMGEMPLFYGLADLALLGGSFEPLGGHNLIEAAACGCPIILGPSTFNFAEAAERALAAGAAWRAADLGGAVGLAMDLLDQGRLAGQPDPRLDNARNRAVEFAAAHEGAAERMASAILKLLPEPVSAPAGR